jgi:hypothetical protein
MEIRMFNSVLAAFALALGGLAVTTADAAAICVGCEYQGESTYLGSHDPSNGDGSTFQNTDPPPGNFTNDWLFQVDPGGQVAVNAIFIPTHRISNFQAALHEATPTCAPGAPGSACGIALGALVATATVNPDFVANLEFTNLGAGFYVFRITGSVAEGLAVASYSGNLTTQVTVPEPAMAGLLGLALLGAGLARRRRA